MFDLPEAKRIKRSQLFSSNSTDGSSDDGQDSFSSLESGHDAIARTTESGKPIHKVVTSGHGETEVGSAMDVDYTGGYGFEYDFIDVAQINTSSTQVQESKKDEDEDEDADDNSNLKEDGQSASTDSKANVQKEQTYEFLLFKPKSTIKPTKSTTENSTILPSPSETQEAKPQINRITIRSPTPEADLSQNPGSILKPRPHSYYFTTYISPSEQDRLRDEFQQIALSGEQIEKLSHQSWPGTFLPWRVTNVPTAIPKSRTKSLASKRELHSSDTNHTNHDDTLPTNETNNGPTSTPTPNPNSNPNRRPKPSKKRRLQLHKRKALRLTQQKLLLASQEEKEKLDREKRTRKNREKKVKRKERDREKIGKLGVVQTGGNNNSNNNNGNNNNDGGGGDGDNQKPAE